MSTSKVPVYRGKRLDKRTRLKILKGTRALLAQKGVWIRGSFYRKTVKGTEQFCLVGACNYVAGQVLDIDTRYFPGNNKYKYADPELPNLISLHEFARSKGFNSIPHLNDSVNSKKRLALSKGLDGVLALLDEKIAMEEGK